MAPVCRPCAEVIEVRLPVTTVGQLLASVVGSAPCVGGSLGLADILSWSLKYSYLIKGTVAAATPLSICFLTSFFLTARPFKKVPS